jgi:hypothetical protein
MSKCKVVILCEFSVVLNLLVEIEKSSCHTNLNVWTHLSDHLLFFRQFQSAYFD